jgi:hypothetical protein
LDENRCLQYLIINFHITASARTCTLCIHTQHLKASNSSTMRVSQKISFFFVVLCVMAALLVVGGDANSEAVEREGPVASTEVENSAVALEGWEQDELPHTQLRMLAGDAAQGDLFGTCRNETACKLLFFIPGTPVKVKLSKFFCLEACFFVPLIPDILLFLGWSCGRCT